MELLSDFILRHAKSIVASLTLVTLLLGAFATRVQIDDSVETMLLYDDLERIYYRHFLERFGSDELVVIAVEAPRLFSAPSLERIKRISDALARLSIDDEDAESLTTPLIDRVTSLSNVTRIGSEQDSSGESTLVVGPFLEELPRTTEEQHKLWEQAVNDPLYLGNLISRAPSDDPDAPLTTLILGRIVYREGDLHYRRTVLDEVEKILEQEFGPAGGSRETRTDRAEVSAFHVAGTAILKATLGRTAERDLAKTLPLAYLLIFGVFFLLFRTVPAVLLPLGTVVLAVIWTVGLMTLCGSPLNIVSIAILPLITVIGVIAAIHLFSCYYRATRTIRDPSALVRHVLVTMGWPCFLASFTTAVGFASLGVSEIVPVREVGLYSAFGVMAALVIAILLVPISIKRLSLQGLVSDASVAGRTIGNILGRLPAFAERFRWPIVLGAGALLGVAVVGISRVTVETDVLGFLGKDHSLRKAYRFIRGELGGIDPLDVTITTGAGGLMEPDVLSRIDRLQAWLEEQPEVDGTFSIVDYLKRMNQEMFDGDPRFYRIPQSRAAAEQHLLLLESTGDVEPFFWRDGGEEGRAEEARVSVRLRSIRTAELVGLIERTEAYLAANVATDPSLAFDRAALFPAVTGMGVIDGLYYELRNALGLGKRADAGGRWPAEALDTGEVAARVTGVSLLYAVMVDSLVEGQVRSLVLAAVGIWITVVLVLRSPWAGTIAMIPNLLPVLVVLGLMGYVGVTLNLGTAMISSVCLGIAVDDTILFMTRYRRNYLELRGERAAIAATLGDVGQPIIFTSVALALGFWIMCISSYEPHFSFGLLSGVTVLMALASDLLLLPAFLLILRPRLHRGTGHVAYGAEGRSLDQERAQPRQETGQPVSEPLSQLPDSNRMRD